MVRNANLANWAHPGPVDITLIGFSDNLAVVLVVKLPKDMELYEMNEKFII